MTSPNPKPDRGKLIVTLVPILLVVVTFLFWYQTWFGRPLNDSEISEYLTDTSVPHKTQHALAQLGDRISRGDPAARRWYPQVLALASNREPGFRLMAAWVMGQDGRAPEFHRALVKLLKDSDPMVRGNAALALVRFGDASGHEELRRMLESSTVAAPAAGTVRYKVKSGDPVHRGSLVARLEAGGAPAIEVRSLVEGRVEKVNATDGDSVAAGQALAVISPAEDQVFEVLRGLYLVGQPADLSEVERFAREGSGVSPKVREQAALTVHAIQSRAAETHMTH